MMFTTMTPAPVADGTQEFLRYPQTGEGAVLEELLREWAPRAYTQVWRTLGNRADAEDAVQEALIQLMRTSGDYDPRIPFPA